MSLNTCMVSDAGPWTNHEYMSDVAGNEASQFVSSGGGILISCQANRGRKHRIFISISTAIIT